MVVSFLQILQESVTKLLPKGDHSLANLGNVAIFAMASTIIVKGIIGLGCVKIKTTQVQALVQDCKTDVIFNTLSLAFPLIGSKVGAWWLDPLGAALLSLFIIYDWSETCFENVTRLSGSAVEDRLYSKLVFLAYRFSPVVDGFKSLVAYHAGDGVWVEIDVLLDSQASLSKAHDVAETLQYCLEGLQDVDRAFVTVDCEYFFFLFPERKVLMTCRHYARAVWTQRTSRITFWGIRPWQLHIQAFSALKFLNYHLYVPSTEAALKFWVDSFRPLIGPLDIRCRYGELCRLSLGPSGLHRTITMNLMCFCHCWQQYMSAPVITLYWQCDGLQLYTWNGCSITH